MHEYSLIQSLVARVEAEARARRAVAIHRVVVRVGDLSGVDPDLFRTAYETFRAGTVCEGAALELWRVEADWRCPACGTPAALAEGSDAILLETIEMEVP